MFTYEVVKGVFSIFLNRKLVACGEKGALKPLTCFGKNKVAIIKWSIGVPYRVEVENLNTGKLAFMDFKSK